MFKSCDRTVACVVLALSLVSPAVTAAPDYAMAPRAYFFNVSNYSDGLARVQTRLEDQPGDGFGYVDRHGRFVIAPQYDRAKSFHEGRAAVAHRSETQLRDFWGFIDRHGTTVTEQTYTAAHSFSGGLAAVQSQDGHWQFIDRSGQSVLDVPEAWYGVDAHNPNLHHPLNDFHNGWLFIVDGDNGYNFVDRDGHKLREKPFPQAEPFSDGLATVALTATPVPGPEGDNPLARMYARLPGPQPQTYDWAVIDTQGTVRFHIPDDMERVGRFVNGRASFYRHGHWGVIDDRGQVVIPARHAHKPRGYGHDITLFAVDGQRADNSDGYMETYNRDGERIARIPFVDDQGRSIMDGRQRFHEGLLGVEWGTGLGDPKQFKSLGWGFIDAHGRVVVEPQFENVMDFVDGRAFVFPKDTAKAGVMRNPRDAAQQESPS